MPQCDKSQYSLVTLQLLHDGRKTAEVINSINNLAYLTFYTCDVIIVGVISWSKRSLKCRAFNLKFTAKQIFQFSGLIFWLWLCLLFLFITQYIKTILETKSTKI